MPISPEAQAAHIQAMSNGEDHYMDPETGYVVMTAQFLKNRNYCCSSGCRHCPYGMGQG